MTNAVMHPLIRKKSALDALKSIILVSDIQNIWINHLFATFIIYFQYKSSIYLRIYFSFHRFSYSIV